MFFKIILLGIIFFVLRNLLRSWQTLQAADKQFKNNNSKNKKSSSESSKDAIDAEYTVVDDK